MSEPVSTKREDVERLAKYVAAATPDAGYTAATLRALIDERDAAVVRAERWDTEAAAARAIIPRLETERDAARAEVARLREALERIADQEWVENCLDPQWPARIARAALAGGGPR